MTSPEVSGSPSSGSSSSRAVSPGRRVDGRALQRLALISKGELLGALAEAEPATLYVGSTTVDTCLPGFRAENDITIDGYDPLASIWIGNRTRVAAHYDLPDNIACCVAGRRRFVLNLEELPWLNSTGVGHLIAARRRIDEAEGEVDLPVAQIAQRRQRRERKLYDLRQADGGEHGEAEPDEDVVDHAQQRAAGIADHQLQFPLQVSEGDGPAQALEGMIARPRVPMTSRPMTTAVLRSISELKSRISYPICRLVAFVIVRLAAPDAALALDCSSTAWFGLRRLPVHR